MRRLAAFLPFAFLAATALALPACADDPSASDDSEGERGGIDEDGDDSRSLESNLTSAEKDAICNRIPAPRAWTADEQSKLASEVVRRFVELKKNNDALVAQRGVGGYAGARTEVYKALGRNDVAAAAAIIKPKLKPGFDAMQVAKSIQGTSCIGRVYEVLREVYKSLGREAEWTAIEKCGRAWDSDGLHVQQALIKNGWPAPTLGFVTDEVKPPGPAGQDADIHVGFLRSIPRGTYFGTPVSKTTVLKNFLPTAGSPVRKDESRLLEIGSSKFLAVGTLRAAYHVPFIVDAAAVPDAAIPQFLAAKRRGEPFVMESHSLRQPWDATNFEIRPLTEVIKETMTQGVVYSSGTILFAPGSSYVVR
ncbi:MAG: hypothetical protein JST00_32180 [Deltaproteobacteria bacterium]|nr:hypothetical protein [Deltaproteobacteria bacterium]